MATKTLRVFAEYTSTGFVPMPTAGNIDYGYTLGSTFPATTPTTFQTDNPDLVVTVTAMTDFYVWIRVNGTAWNPSYTRNVRVYPDSPNINNVVMNMIIATGPAGVSSYTQIVQTSNRLYFNGATTDSIYNSKFAGKTYINELNFGTAPGLATVATSGAYADLTGKPSLATVATSGLFTDLSSKPSGTAPLSYNSGTNSFVITQANTSTNGYLSSTDWNTFNNKFATPAGTTLQYVDGTGALQTFPLLASADKLVINVRNSSGVSMPKGSVVYINGATGNKPTVALAQANSDASSAQTLGLLQATLANNAEGNVVIVGSVIDLNTSAFTEGQQLYLSPTTAGAYTVTKQYAPNHLVYVGVVTRSHVSLGTIDVKVQNGYEMDELHNVSAQSPSNNDGLFYNTTTSLWEKKSIATVLGYTPYNGTDTSIKALFSASAPLSYSNGAFSISQASASTNGYLSSTDWNTFNNKSSTSGTVTSVAMTMPLGLSVSGSPITTSGTFGITLTAGYVIPSTTSTSEWGIAYNNRITSLTVTGSSGSASLVSNVLNIPTYTLVGLGGQPALSGTGFVKISGTTISYDNSTYLTTASASSTYLTIATASSTYQTIITNNITGTGTINELAYFNTASSIASLGVATYPSLTELAYVKGVTSAIQTQLNAKASTLSGTTNYIPKFTSSTAIGDSLIFDNGTTTFVNATTGGFNTPRLLINNGNGVSIGFQVIADGGGRVSRFQTSDFNNTNTGSALRIGFGAASGNTYSTINAYSAGESVSNNLILNEAGGNVGIGTTTISASTNYRALNINGTSGSEIFLKGNNVDYGYIYANSAGVVFATQTAIPLYFQTNTINRLTISSTGAANFSSSVTVAGESMIGWGLDNSGVNSRVWGIRNGWSTGGDLAFITSSTNNTTLDTTRLTINRDGKVGIGTASPGGKLDVRDVANGTFPSAGQPGTGLNIRRADGILGMAMGYEDNQGNSYIQVQRMDGTTSYQNLTLQPNGGNVLIGTNSNSGDRLYVSGTIRATGNIIANSDLTLKKNLKLIDNPIDKLMQLNGYAYQWKSNDEHQYGVIAQEVEKILPYAVSTGNDGIKGVSYNQIIPVLIEAIKTQQAEINSLKSKLA